MSKPGSRAIVIAYDGSEPARGAIEAAAETLEHGTKAYVATIWEPLNALPFWGAPVGAVPQDLLDNVENQAEKVAAEGAEAATAAGFDAEAVVEEGNPVWRSIIKIAEKHDAGLIVIGSHGRTGLSYVLAGSVATAVMQHAPCSVMVARPPTR